MGRVRVLGCGNVLAGDDGVGVEVVRALKREEFPPEVELVEAGVPGLLLLELLLGAEKVIIVDAVEKGEPGKILKLREEDLPPPNPAPLSAHDLGIPEALALLRRLKPAEAPREIVVVGVQVAKVERFKEGLSPAVAAAVSKAAAVVKEEIFKGIGRK